MRRLALALLLLMAARPVAAQPAQAAAPGFLTVYRFHLNAASIATDDERFGWDVDFGGDLDLIDYGAGRLNFLVNYEAILGDEFRGFDPNQGNYTLDFSSSVRVGGGEIAAVFHHVSRHFSDRPKRFAIDWNSVGVRAAHRAVDGRVQVDSHARYERINKRSFVDYAWEAGAGAAVRYAVGRRWTVIGAGEIAWVGIDRDLSARDRQTAGRVEGGMRLTGRGGALELFVAYERRVDAHPIDRETRKWALVGCRLLNR